MAAKSTPDVHALVERDNLAADPPLTPPSPLHPLSQAAMSSTTLDTDTDLGEAPRNELVFALARGVATVVAVAAFCLIAVMVIIGKALVITIADTIGLSAIIGLVVVLSTVSMKKFGVDVRVVLGAMDM
jgi:lipopolysaccharide export LptBFGC system permease protein LptF